MPHKNTNKQPTPTRQPAYSPTQQSTLWDSVKAGFGMSMGSRMFGFIFGDPTVKVEHKNLPPPQPTSVYKEQNNCDTLREQIKFYQCDNEIKSSQCDDLFRQYYSCQKNN